MKPPGGTLTDIVFIRSALFAARPRKDRMDRIIYRGGAVLLSDTVCGASGKGIELREDVCGEESEQRSFQDNRSTLGAAGSRYNRRSDRGGQSRRDRAND